MFYESSSSLLLPPFDLVSERVVSGFVIFEWCANSLWNRLEELFAFHLGNFFANLTWNRYIDHFRLGQAVLRCDFVTFVILGTRLSSDSRSFRSEGNSLGNWDSFG